MAASAVRVAVLADHPSLIEEVGLMRWREWGEENPDPAFWVSVTGAEAGGGLLSTSRHRST